MKRRGRAKAVSGCEFEHEGFCIVENNIKCKFQEGDLRVCTAKPEDLIEICIDCDKPMDECECWK